MCRCQWLISRAYYEVLDRVIGQSFTDCLIEWFCLEIVISLPHQNGMAYMSHCTCNDANIRLTTEYEMDEGGRYEGRKGSELVGYHVVQGGGPEGDRHARFRPQESGSRCVHVPGRLSRQSPHGGTSLPQQSGA